MSLKITHEKRSFGPAQREVEVGDITLLATDKPMRLDSGAEISHFPMAFRTYGTLNKDKSNAILICHGLTGDQYMLETHPVTGKPGWWEQMAGKGKPLDTDKYFLICPNVLGGCLGSFGPKEINPNTQQPYNLDFPVITIRDTVRAQKALMDAMGIEILYAVVGGSMGGMQALEWLASYPEKVQRLVALATASRHTAQNIAFHEIGRQAIMADPDWQQGNYLNKGTFPSKGLSVSRMTAHVTYLSDDALARKFGRELQDRDRFSYGFEADFQVESYLRYQGMSFVDRFDPNSYLYITRAMDYFDLEADYGSLAQAFGAFKGSALMVSFSSDWLFPTGEAKRVVQALAGCGADVRFMEIDSDKGHDAFLLDEPELFSAVKGFIAE